MAAEQRAALITSAACGACIQWLAARTVVRLPIASEEAPMSGWLAVRCVTCTKQLTIPAGTTQLPPHDRADVPGQRCTGTMWEAAR